MAEEDNSQKQPEKGKIIYKGQKYGQLSENKISDFKYTPPPPPSPPKTDNSSKNKKQFLEITIAVEKKLKPITNNYHR